MVRCRYLKGGDACIFFLYPAGIQERRRICMKWINVAKITKWILDFMFYAGIAACFTLPFSLRFIGKFFPHYEIFYVPMLILFFISGVFAILIILELRCMFQTVLEGDCFVKENVKSLERMAVYSFFIAVVSGARLAIVITPATLVIILIFVIA